MISFLIRGCFAAILLFVVLHIFFGAQFDLFNLDRERTPAALFSAFQFIFSGYAMLVLFFTHEKHKKKFLWLTLMFMFIFLGFDEISEIHENAAYYLVKYIPAFPFLGSGTPMWIVFLGPFIIGVFGLLIAAIREMYVYSRRLGLILIAALAFVIVALALEFLGGIVTLNPFLPLFVIFEESAELIAGTLFLNAFSQYAKERFFAYLQKNKELYP